MASASTRSAAGRRASSTLPPWRRSCRSRRSCCGGRDTRHRAGLGRRALRLARDPARRLLCRGAPSRCCGTRRGRASGRRCPLPRRSRISCSAGTCCAASPPDTPWGLISIALAVPFLVGAERLARWRDSMPGATEALGYCAAGVAFFIAVAIALELSREWITVAYAVEFAAVAGIAAPLDLHAMRRLCWPLLAVVVVRFVLNPEVLKYPLGVTPIFNWILWGYGLVDRGLRRRAALPAADRRRAAGARDRGGDRAAGLRAAHPRGAQRLPPRRHDGARRAVHGARVLCPGVGRLRARGAVAGAHAPRCRGAVGMARRAAGWPWRWCCVVQVLLANPIFDKADVGRLPIANGLFLAYALPAAMAALARRWIDVEPNRNVALLVEVAASILAFAYVSLRGPPSLRSRLRAARARRRPAWSSTSIPRSGCCSASPCWRWASCAARRRCATPAWRWSASWSPRSS